MLQEKTWVKTPEKVVLDQETVHVWRANLNLDKQFISHCYSLLSEDEQERADRFHFEVDRRQFISRRGILRCILCRYLDIHPENIHFHVSEYGKPSLIESGISFNMTHSKHLALYAISLLPEIGIDIEYMQDGLDFESMAVCSFSPAERKQMMEIQSPLQKEAFYNCWTRKEAFIKALGTGLSFPLDAFDVSIQPGEAARLLRVGDDPEEADFWHLVDLPVFEEFKAALAFRAVCNQIHIHYWDF